MHELNYESLNGKWFYMIVTTARQRGALQTGGDTQRQTDSLVHVNGGRLLYRVVCFLGSHVVLGFAKGRKCLVCGTFLADSRLPLHGFL